MRGGGMEDAITRQSIGRGSAGYGCPVMRGSNPRPRQYWRCDEKARAKDKGRAEATGRQPDVKVVALDKLSGPAEGQLPETAGSVPHSKACMEY